MPKKAQDDREQGSTVFSPGPFTFLKELAANNDREWFLANKARYEADARNPMLAFIGELGEPLGKISRHFSADPRPVGGSMFRIHRDTRFSKDKSPYKTHLGAHFPYKGAAEGVHGPGFYLHLEPGACFAGGGLWHAEPATLFKMRSAIAVQPNKAWKAILASGLEIEGKSLKRVPQGFPPDHPFGEDLKRKDFYIGTSFTDKQVLAPDFLSQVAAAWAQAGPLVKFTCKALDLAF